MNPFGSLSYNNKTIAPIGDPIEELTALYKKKDEDYNYVLDTTNALDSALSNMPYNAADKPLVDAAKEHMRSTIGGFKDAGDLENKVLDTKKLANDLNNRYGLSAIQKDYQARQAYQSELKERLGKKAEDGGISMQDYNRALAFTNRNTAGVQKDENGDYLPSFQGKEVLNNYNFSDRVAEKLKGFKANTEILVNDNGQQIVKDPNGSGYMIAGTNESVQEEDLIQAAKASLYSDPDFQDRVDEETFYELDRILTDPQTGERREMVAQDLENVLGAKMSKTLAEKYDASSLEELQAKVEAQGGDLEQVFGSVQAEMIANRAIQFGVGKESYNKYNATYLKDWQMAMAMKNASEKASATISNFGTLTTYETEDRLTTDDFQRSAAIYNQSKENIDELEAEQAQLRQNGGHPDQIKAKQAEIDAQKRLVNLSEQRSKNILRVNPEMEEGIRTVVANQGATRASGMMQPKINGLNISEGSMENLILQNISESVDDKEFAKYINIDKEEYTKNWALESLNNANVKSGVDLAEAAERIRTEGESAYPDIFDDYTLKGIQMAHGKAVNHSANRLRKEVERLGTTVNEKIENKEYNYTEEFKGYLLPEMAADERRSHPIAVLEDLTGQMTKNTNYYTSLAHAGSNLDVKSYIEEQYDVDDEDGEINWAEGKLIPLMDKKADPKTGAYNNTIILQVPVGDKDESKVIQVPVYTGEETYNLKANEALAAFQQSLAAKGNTLSPSERKHLERTNLNLFNTTQYGKDMDLMNLRNMQNRETVKADITDEYSAYIKAFNKSSPQGMSYYLVDGEGENARYYAQDNEGKQKLMTEEELAASKTFKAVGGNSLYDLKTKIANKVFNSGIMEQKDYNVDLENTVNLNSIFNSDMKANVTPLLSRDKEPIARTLKMNFPNLIVTDALRTKDTTIGVNNSNHKTANALDFRLNADAKKLVSLSPEQKRAIGIKSAEIHDGDHVHLEFL